MIGHADPATREHYRLRLQELVQQRAFKPGLAAATRQITLSDKVATLDTGLVSAIVLAVIEVVVGEAMGIGPMPGDQP